MPLHRQEFAHNKDLQTGRRLCVLRLASQADRSNNEFIQRVLLRDHTGSLKHQEQEFETASRVSDKTEL